MKHDPIDDDDNRGVGVPRQYPGKPLISPQPQPATSESRSDENLGVGVPKQAPRGETVIYDPAIHGPAVSGVVHADIPDSEPAWSWLAVLRDPTLVAVLTLIGSALLLLVVSEVSQFLLAVQALPIPLRVIGYVLLTISIGLLVWSASRLFLVFFGRPVTPQIDLAHIHDASSRSMLQDLQKRNVAESKQLLERLLQDYRLDDPKLRSLMLASGKTDEDLREFKGLCQKLLSNINSSDEDWIQSFSDSVLPFFDDCARNRIQQYAKQVGVRTGLMPTGAIDLLIVSSNSLAMLGDICLLYGVSATRFGMCSIGMRIFMNTFVAARLEGQIDMFVKTASAGNDGGSMGTGTSEAVLEAKKDLVASFFSEGTSSIFSSMASALSSVTFSVGKRAAEGFGNYLLCLRFGDSCVKLIRPVRH